MTWIPSELVSNSTSLRSALRRAGITKAVASLRPLLGHHQYEDRVHRAMVDLIREGDCVWDVGANIGLYTTQFAKLVGSTGHVVAFEPIAATYNALCERTTLLPNVHARHEALGSTTGTTIVSLQDDPTSPTNSLVGREQATDACLETVTITSGDALVESGLLTVPSLIKIDTEGFEEDVLWGMRSTLRNTRLRALVIEMHFAQLELRGYRRAPSRICSLLTDEGFSLRWLDPSHVLAKR